MPGRRLCQNATSRRIAASSPVARIGRRRPRMARTWRLHLRDRIVNRPNMWGNVVPAVDWPTRCSIVAAVISTANSRGPTSSCRSRARSARSSACKVSNCSFSRRFCAAAVASRSRHVIEAVDQAQQLGRSFRRHRAIIVALADLLESDRQFLQRPQGPSDNGTDQQGAQPARSPPEPASRHAIAPRLRRSRSPDRLAARWQRRHQPSAGSESGPCQGCP